MALQLPALVGPVMAGHDAVLALLAGTVGGLRDIWEATSFEIERLQAAEACVAEEQAGLASRVAPSWHLSFTPTATPPEKLSAKDKVAMDSSGVSPRCHAYAEFRTARVFDLTGLCRASG